MSIADTVTNPCDQSLRCFFDRRRLKLRLRIEQWDERWILGTHRDRDAGRKKQCRRCYRKRELERNCHSVCREKGVRIVDRTSKCLAEPTLTASLKDNLWFPVPINLNDFLFTQYAIQDDKLIEDSMQFASGIAKPVADFSGSNLQ